MAETLENAVRLTERAVFPFARLVRKLDTFPPGQAATKNIPRATLGGGFSKEMTTQVKNGSTINWENTPKRNPFGC